ncbi:endo alpha-1,4 polygalactosaminidase [Streptomyces sp. NPDC086023]|uniref:endo alpha-1,4 polygalactosaminidase n=1 Tax=Streptomyces sp. NPDC086023 TaxID=3365746 RepID=UPI0037D6CF83
MLSHPLPSRPRRLPRAGLAVAAVCALAAGLPAAAEAADGPEAAAATVTPPRGNSGFDYQLGGAYPPRRGVEVVVRDRSDRVAAGVYNVCYVNAFQAQAEELRWWQRNHPSLLLKDANGRHVVDEDWNEVLLDTSTAAKRTRLAAVVGRWFDGCARDGFKAVEPDNLDSYERSKRLLSTADNVAFARLLTARAHAAGLAVAQKNTVELAPKGRRIGFDFAVAEECGRYDECGGYVSAYGSRVFVVEYRSRDFTKACAAWGDRLSVIQRDRDLRPRGTTGYVRKAC